MNIIEKIRETVEYRVKKNYLFSLGKLMKNHFRDNWYIEKFTHMEDGEYIVFARDNRQ